MSLTLSTGSLALITSMLGGGVLFLPSAFLSLGYVYGSIVLFMSSISSFYTLYCISYSAYSFRRQKLQELKKNKTIHSSSNKQTEYQKQTEIKTENKPHCDEINDYLDHSTLPNKNHDGQKQSKSNNGGTNVGTNCKKAANFYSESRDTPDNVENVKEESVADIDAGITYYTVAAERSRWIAILVDISLILNGCGSCVCYIKTISAWINKIFGTNWPVQQISFGAIVPLYVLALQPSLSALRFASVISVTAVFYLAIMLICYALLYGQPAPNPDGSGLEASARFLFALSAHQNAVQIFSELGVKRLSAILQVGAAAYIIGPLLYALIGAAGVRAAGGAAKEDILSAILNPQTKIYKSIIAKDSHLVLPRFGAIMFLTVLTTAFPMQLFPASLSLFNILNFTPLSKYMKKKLLARRVITSVLTALVLIIAILPNIETEKVVSFIGATATVGIAFIFPALLYSLTIGKVNAKTILSSTVAILGLLFSAKLVKDLIFKP